VVPVLFSLPGAVGGTAKPGVDRSAAGGSYRCGRQATGSVQLQARSLAAVIPCGLLIADDHVQVITGVERKIDVVRDCLTFFSDTVVPGHCDNLFESRWAQSCLQMETEVLFVVRRPWPVNRRGKYGVGGISA
jgi:hypothetical protein